MEPPPGMSLKRRVLLQRRLAGLAYVDGAAPSTQLQAGSGATEETNAGSGSTTASEFRPRKRPHDSANPNTASSAAPAKRARVPVCAPEGAEVVQGSDQKDRQHAKCKWWNSDRKFGFVTLDDTGLDAFVHYTHIDTFPRKMEQGDGCVVTVSRNKNGKLAAYNVEVDGCERTDPSAGLRRAEEKKKKSRACGASPPLFQLTESPNSTLTARERVDQALDDFGRELQAWMCTWQVHSRVAKESSRVCESLRRELYKEVEAHGTVNQDIITALASALTSQLTKRREARLMISNTAAKRHGRVGGDAAAPASTSATASMGKGLSAMGPVEGLRAILGQFGPMTVSEMSAVYKKMTGQGFKKAVGSQMNHILRENSNVFKKSADKRWHAL